MISHMTPNALLLSPPGSPPPAGAAPRSLARGVLSLLSSEDEEQYDAHFTTAAPTPLTTLLNARLASLEPKTKRVKIIDHDGLFGPSWPVGAPAPSAAAAPAFARQPQLAAVPWWEEEDNELCHGLCMQSAECRLDHMCQGPHCFMVRGARKGVPHRVPRSGFGATAGGKRHKGCMQGNNAAKARPSYGKGRAENNARNNAKNQAKGAEKRAEEASIPSFDVIAVESQEIAGATAAYKRALDGFVSQRVDVYAFVASTGSGERYSLKNESVSSIFRCNGNPILRSSKWSAKGSDDCLIPDAERFSINNSDHVFEMADAGRGASGKELAHRIEKALHIFGEQHAAASGGRIKPLWRGRGKGYPQGIGPYKVGLLVIERNAAGCLPFGWKRTDGA